VAAVGHEGVIAYDFTLGAYNTNKFLEFIQTKAIPSLDRQRSIIMDNVPFTDLMLYNKLLKMLDTSTFVCHHIVHFPMLQNGYLDTSKAITMEMITLTMTYKIIKHY
jgi:hypothetical protein